jgi:hypothetical protein
MFSCAQYLVRTYFTDSNPSRRAPVEQTILSDRGSSFRKSTLSTFNTILSWSARLSQKMMDSHLSQPRNQTYSRRRRTERESRQLTSRKLSQKRLKRGGLLLRRPISSQILRVRSESLKSVTITLLQHPVPTDLIAKGFAFTASSSCPRPGPIVCLGLGSLIDSPAAQYQFIVLQHLSSLCSVCSFWI